MACRHARRALGARLVDAGVQILAPPIWMLLSRDAGGEIVPSSYARSAAAAGLELIPWTLERSGTLVELPNAERPSEFRVGLRNFYVITRYNRSVNYAMVVYELARELRAVVASEAGSP